MIDVKKLSLKLKLILGLVILLVIGIFILINWSIYRILHFFLGSLPSMFALFFGYYFSFRKLVRMLAFPGTSMLMKRSLEFDYCKSMSRNVL